MVNKFAKFRKAQDGNATIEFVILFPGLIALFLTGFEAGFYMVRNVSLERAVDIAVRDVRLGNSSAFGGVPSHTALKQRICDQVGIIPNCMQDVKVEVMRVDKQPGGVASALGNQVRCIDKDAPPGSQVPDLYNTGIENDLMLIHVCALSQPVFPTSALGVGMKIDSQGNYAIVVATGFVNEPGARSLMAGGNGNLNSNVIVGGNGNTSATNGYSASSQGNGALTTSGNQGNGPSN